jgi:hypothetical protein
MRKSVCSGCISHSVPHFPALAALLGPSPPAQSWSKFVAFLDGAGLLTHKVQSRGPAGHATTSLDALRAGGGGERVPPPAVEALATNEFLPLTA